MRDKKHYEGLLQQNSRATVGFNLAAAMVYAARYGICEAEHYSTDEYRRIARDLRQKYGDVLNCGEVKREMRDIKKREIDVQN